MACGLVGYRLRKDGHHLGFHPKIGRPRAATHQFRSGENLAQSRPIKIGGR
jgi:hypothetical protein